MENVGDEATPLHLTQLCPPEATPASGGRDDILRAAFNHLLDETKPEVYEALLHRFGGVTGLYVHLLFTSSSELEKLYVMMSGSDGPEVAAERHITDVIDALVEERGENGWTDEWLNPFLETIPPDVSQSARDGTQYPLDERGPKTQAVTWEDVEPAARRMFRVNAGNADWQWARSVWPFLADQGLTAYQNEREHARVLLRLMALNVIYHRFYARAWDTTMYEEYGDWTAHAEVDERLLYRMHGLEPGTEYPELRPSPLRDVVSSLIDDVLPEVYHALKEGYGDLQKLFAWLWLAPKDEGEYRYWNVETVRNEETGDLETIRSGHRTDDQIVSDVLNGPSAAKMAAYEYLMDEAAGHLSRFDSDE